MMNFTEAETLHKSQCFGGQNKNIQEYVFPYNVLYIDEEFVEIEIPTTLLEFQEIDENRVDKYKKILAKKKMGACWVSFGKKLRNESVIRHWHQKFYILDGNHRAMAQIRLGIEEIKAIMPKSHHELYVRTPNVA